MQPDSEASDPKATEPVTKPALDMATKRIAIGTVIGFIMLAAGIVLLSVITDWRIPVMMIFAGLGLIGSGVAFAIELFKRENHAT